MPRKGPSKPWWKGTKSTSQSGENKMKANRLGSVGFVALLTSGVFWVGLSETQGQEDPANQLAQGFLDHLKTNAPVAGTFEERTWFDPELHEDRIKKPVKGTQINNKFYKVKSEPQSQVYQCSWAWDGAREVLEAPAERDWPKTFLNTPEGFLDMVG